MDRIDLMRTFVRVVERGSFSSVARELGLGQPAVSKQVAALEADLGAELIRRTSRHGADRGGTGLLRSGAPPARRFRRGGVPVGAGQSAPSGLVRITVAQVFGDRLITPRLGDFFRRYPNVSVQFIVTEKLVDVIEEGVDLCVYNGEVVQPEMIARKVAMASVVTVATPAYLAARGTPRSVAELVAHDGVGFSPEGAPRPWTFAGGQVHAPRGPFRSHDAGQIRAAALAGLGLAHTPKWLFDDALADGRVVEVLAEFARAPIPVSLAFSTRRPPPKVRVLADFLAETIRDQADRL
jgi:DNA-binding transcriptional LysR family regulator